MMWDIYGLSGDPFSTDPIKVDSEKIPISSFVSRENKVDELKILINQFESKGGSKTMIVGDVGVGKTSFVNYALRLVKSKYFYVTVNVQKGCDTEKFLFNTFSDILDSLNKEIIKIGLIKKTAKNLLKKDTIEKLESLVELNRISGENKSISLHNVGFGYGKETSNPVQISFNSLENLFESIINQIYEKSKKETIIVYDDLDRIENLDEVKEIFDNMKNIFQTEYVHFVFVGNFSIYSAIKEVRSMRNIISMCIELKPLSSAKISDVIERRLTSMKLKGKDLIRPYKDNSVIDLIYYIYDKNIKTILDALGSAVVIATSQNNNNPVTLTNEEIFNVIWNTMKITWEHLETCSREILEFLFTMKFFLPMGLTIDFISQNMNKNAIDTLQHLNGPLKPYVKVELLNGKETFRLESPEIEYFIFLNNKYYLKKQPKHLNIF